MLHYSTVDQATLELLVQLMQLSAFQNMRLAGGTSLALQIGHRKSIDLDLFGRLEADEYEVSALMKSFNSATMLNRTANIQSWVVNGIKVDVVNYNYPWLDLENTEGGIRLAAVKDIAAMKLAAITGRGTKKDFIDLYFLLKSYKLDDILSFYSEKYSEGSLFLVLKSLVYFEDAEDDPMPVMLQDADWDIIKVYISNTVSTYLANL